MSTRAALETNFTVVTTHPTVKGKYMVVTSERPCGGCRGSAAMCAYILSPLGDQIFKASKCTHCASTKSRCGQAGALYRFDKGMSEGHLIDPYASTASEDEASSPGSTLSTPESTDSGNEGGSEEGPSSANTSGTSASASANTSANAVLDGVEAPARRSGSAERVRRSSPPALSPSTSVLLEKRPVDDLHLRADSPGKTVRFALPPPSPPLSNTSPTINGEGVFAPSSPVSPTRSVTPPVMLKANTKAKAASGTPAPAPSAAPTPATPTPPLPPAHTTPPSPEEEHKLHRIMNKLVDLEVRLACLESVNHELHTENRRLCKKNSTLKRVVATVRASSRVSGDALARALRLVEEVDADRRRLMDEIK